MTNKRLGKQTVALAAPPSICAGACVGGKMEKAGPLAAWFDCLEEDSFFGQQTWEKA